MPRRKNSFRAPCENSRSRAASWFMKGCADEGIGKPNFQYQQLIDRHGPIHPTSSGHGTMVDFTVFIAIASATARPMPYSENGYSVCISSQGYLCRVRYSISTPSGRSLPVILHEPSK